MTEDRPLGALALGVIAGVLDILVGVALIGLSQVATSLGSSPLSFALGAEGAAGLIFGLLFVLLAIGLYRSPEAHRGYGVAMLVVAVLSVVVGLGMLLGGIFGFIGGILAIVFPDESDAEVRPLLPGSGVAPEREAVWPATFPTPAASAPPPEPARAAVWVTCPRCHRVVDQSAGFCPYCTAPLRPA